MSDERQIGTYSSKMIELRSKWSRLTPRQRIHELQKVIDATTKKAGFPSPRLTPVGLGSTSGQFSGSQWQLKVNRNLTNRNEMNNEDFIDLADTLYHETRHAEQWSLIARRGAGDGVTKRQLVRRPWLFPPKIAAFALKYPIGGSHSRRACADAMYNSVKGAGRAARNATLSNVQANYAAYRALPEELDAWDVDDRVASTMRAKFAPRPRGIRPE